MSSAYKMVAEIIHEVAIVVTIKQGRCNIPKCTLLRTHEDIMFIMGWNTLSELVLDFIHTSNF